MWANKAHTNTVPSSTFIAPPRRNGRVRWRVVTVHRSVHTPPDNTSKCHAIGNRAARWHMTSSSDKLSALPKAFLASTDMTRTLVTRPCTATSPARDRVRMRSHSSKWEEKTLDHGLLHIRKRLLLSSGALAAALRLVMFPKNQAPGMAGAEGTQCAHESISSVDR